MGHDSVGSDIHCSGRHAVVQCRHGGDLRTALHHGHPSAGPQPQRHQAKQEAKEKAAHSQIICQCMLHLQV
jgi:hypothetical protein